MIIKVKKFLIYGIKEEVDRFLHSAQKAGFIEFIHPSAKRIQQMPGSLKEIVAAIKILKHYPKAEEEKQSLLSMEAISSHVVHLQHQLDQLHEESVELQKEINRISPFGHFTKQDIKYLEKEAKRFMQFFCIPSDKRKNVQISEELIYINTEYDLDYYIALTKKRTSFPNMMEIYIDKTLTDLEARLSIVQSLIKEKEKEIKEHAPYLEELKKEFFHQMNSHNLENVKKSLYFPSEQSIFFIEAWVPVTHLKHFENLIRPFSVQYEYIAIEKKDRIPTYMENKNLSKIGEDIVKIYDIPSIEDKDPSLWVFVFFAIFFAMIVSDAGYGLVFLLIALFAKWKFPRPKETIRRFIKLMMILSVTCMGWGVLTGSYFGFDITPNRSLSKTILMNYLASKKAAYHLHMKDDVYDYWKGAYSTVKHAQSGHEFMLSISQNGKYEAFEAFKKNIFLELSILAGIIHIALSYARYLPRNWSGIGWILFLIGGYLFFPSMLNATTIVNFMGWIPKDVATPVGKIILFMGIILAVIIGFVQKRWKGIGEITNVIQIFSDVLSYLRLYALGLAGMVMAETFNDIFLKVGIITGIFVLIVGHGLTIVLGVMSGVIHGLRLNFIEWYHHSFEGDGKLFNPLRLLK